MESDTGKLQIVAAPSLAADVGATPDVAATTEAAPVSRRRFSWRRVFVRTVLALGYCTYVVLGLWVGGTYVIGPVLAEAQAHAEAVANSPTPRAQFSFPPVFSPIDSVQDLAPLALPDWKGKERINILLLGVDQRDDERAAGIPTRSDTMIVVSIDPVQKSATMISFPRDLWVMIPGFGEERINVAYRTGELRKVDGGGPGLAARTLDLNFGVKTQYYATVDFHGFEEIVNTVGGIVVDVPKPIKDDTYPTDDFGMERIFFSAGPQLMNGSTALKYARTRHTDSDFGRMARQQQVLFAIRDRALRLNMLTRLPTLVDQGLRSVQTNLSTTELLALGKLASDIDPTALGSLQIDDRLARPVIGFGGAALLMPNKDGIRRAVERAMADPRLVKEAAKIETATAGAPLQILAETGDRLAGEGLQVIRAGAPASGDVPTQVIVYTDKPRSLQVVLRTLGLTERNVVRATTADSDADMRVVLGRDFVLPPVGEIRG